MMMKVMTWHVKRLCLCYSTPSVSESMANRRPKNYSYIEEQNEQRTEQLQSKVRRLKDIVIQIDQETKYQIKELGVC